MRDFKKFEKLQEKITFSRKWYSCQETIAVNFSKYFQCFTQIKKKSVFLLPKLAYELDQYLYHLACTQRRLKKFSGCMFSYIFNVITRQLPQRLSPTLGSVIEEK